MITSTAAFAIWFMFGALMGLVSLIGFNTVLKRKENMARFERECWTEDKVARMIAAEYKSRMELLRESFERHQKWRNARAERNMSDPGLYPGYWNHDQVQMWEAR